MTPDEAADRIIAECARDETASIREALSYRRFEIVRIVEKAIAEEREAWAQLMDCFAQAAKTASANFAAIHDAEGEARHTARMQAFVGAAHAIRDRGETT